MTTVPVRLLHLHDAPDAQGEPRAGLLVPLRAGSASTRPIVRVFASVGAALQAKRILELETADAQP